MIDELCHCLEELQKYEQSDAWRRKLLAAVLAKEGPDYRSYSQELLNLALNLLKQKKHAAAEPLFRDRLAMLHKHGSQSWATFETQYLLGVSLLEQQKYDEAEPLLVQGYQGMKNSVKDVQNHHHGPSPRQQVTKALEKVVQLYDAGGKKDEADKWRKELDATNSAKPGKLGSDSRDR
ncbi:MAG TPA: hypothetical protein VKJ47_01860 [Candidatus Binatia bacterium]|nr:hypothetical protein [Candidatus Binatia bacterium]